MLTNKQNYSARSLKVVPETPTAKTLAEAAKRNADTIQAAGGNTTEEVKKNALTKFYQTLNEQFSTASSDVVMKAIPKIQSEAVESSVKDLPEAKRPPLPRPRMLY